MTEPKPVHFLLAWDCAELVVEYLAKDQPRWQDWTTPDRERMHRAVFTAVVAELEAT